MPERSLFGQGEVEKKLTNSQNIHTQTVLLPTFFLTARAEFLVTSWHLTIECMQ